MDDVKRLARQKQIDEGRSAKERNEEGQFATPLPLALEIVRFLKARWPSRKPVEFLEPCVGTGAFYAAIRAEFGKVKRAVGIEKDAEFANAAEELWSKAGLEVVRGDFTRLKPPAERFNVIVTNPPYVRHHHVEANDKVRLQKKTERQTGLRLSGLAGLYCHFMLLADEWLAEGGLSAWLIPSEFLDVNYGVGVKKYLLERVNLLHIHRFLPSDVQFADALVSSSVVVFKKEPPGLGPVILSQGGHLNAPESTTTRTRAELRPELKWGKLFDADATNGMVHRLTFGDLFTIKRGLATGDNGFFIMPIEKAQEHGIPARFLRPILPSPRHLSTHIVRACADGTPDLPKKLFLLDCDLPEEQIQKRHPRFWEYLQSGIQANVHKGYLVSRRNPWYSQEKRPPAPFLCTYMGRDQNGLKPFRFVWNQSQATAHNVYLLLYPKGKLKDALEEQPELAARVFEALCKIDTCSFIGEGRVYGGGLFKMEPKELAAVSAEFIAEAAALNLQKRGLFDTSD